MLAINYIYDHEESAIFFKDFWNFDKVNNYYKTRRIGVFYHSHIAKHDQDQKRYMRNN